MGKPWGQVFVAVVYASVAYVFYVMVISEPWMIKTHQMIQHYGIVEVNLSSGIQTPVFQPIAYPKWDSVKTFDVVFTAASSTIGNGKVAAVALDACKPVFSLTCFENADRTPLLHTTYGTMSKTSHLFSSQAVATPEPRGTIIRGRDVGNPMCGMDLKIPLETRALCQENPSANSSLKIRWELRVTPNWHWTDWIHRDLAEGVFMIAEGLVSLLGGYQLQKW